MCKELYGGEWAKNENAVEVLKMLTAVGGEDGEGYDIEMPVDDFCGRCIFPRLHCFMCRMIFTPPSPDIGCIGRRFRQDPSDVVVPCIQASKQPARRRTWR